LTGGTNHNAKIKLSAGGGRGAGAAEISTGGGGGEKHYNVALYCCQLAVIAAVKLLKRTKLKMYAQANSLAEFYLSWTINGGSKRGNRAFLKVVVLLNKTI
jgi:hypothetical protein